MTGLELREVLTRTWPEERVADADDLLARLAVTWEHLAHHYRLLHAGHYDLTETDALLYATYAITALSAADSAADARTHLAA